MEQMFETRRTEGKGLGCFTCRFIKRGTKILAERPLMRIHGSPRQSIAVFKSLPLHEKRQFVSLHASQGGLCPVSDDSKTNDFDDTIQDIFMTNSFLTASGTESILVIEIARVNHSCLPNAEHSYDTEEGMSTLWAIKDIPVGEEITLSYIDEFQGYEERKKNLERSWNFICDCKACDTTTDFGKASDCRRIVSQQNRRDIDDFAKGQIGDREKPPFKDDNGRVLDTVLETLDLLRLEGLPCSEPEYLAKAAQFSAKVEDLDAAVEFTRKFVEVNALFESGYVKNLNAMRMNLDRLIMRRDCLGQKA